MVFEDGGHLGGVEWYSWGRYTGLSGLKWTRSADCRQGGARAGPGAGWSRVEVDSDAQYPQRAVWGGDVTQGTGDIARIEQAQEADGEVAQAGHDSGSVGGRSSCLVMRRQGVYKSEGL